MWKIVATVVMACGVGTLVGWAVYQFGTAQVREGFYDGQWATTGANQPGQGAKFYLKSDATIDFGTMLTGHRYEREVLIENLGHEVGQFWLAGEPPQAIRLDFPPHERQRIGPRSTHPIVLSCAPLELETPFRKVVVLRTSQHDRSFALTVTGQLQAGVLVTPRQTSLAAPPLGGESQTHVDVCAWQGEDLSQISISGAPDWLNIRTTPIEESELNEKYAGARQGVRIVFQIASETAPTEQELSLIIDLGRRDLVPIPIQVSIIH